MKQVNKSDFLATINPLNVSLRVSEDYPFTTTFSLKTGTQVGKIVDSWTNGVKFQRPIVTNYFLVTTDQPL